MKTKIIATLGPASEDPTLIKQLIEAGVSIFRYNFSHATYPEYQKYYRLIHEISRRLGVPVGVLQDLQGPRIRVGELTSPTKELIAGEIVHLAAEPANGIIPITDARLIGDVRVGDPLLIDSGLIQLEVTGTEDQRITAKVIQGGIIRKHKGINVPRTPLSIRALTEKDKQDVIFALGVGVEYIALSFVQDATDMQELKEFLHGHPAQRGTKGRSASHPVKILPKIERQQAVKHFDQIATVSDLIMIARGDLGVELPAEEIPIIQRQLIRQAHRHHKPVIVATQLLSSMIKSSQPTRAEMSDIVTAVEEGAEYLMVSDETAIGKHPVEVINYLVRGIEAVEKERRKRKRALGKEEK